MNTLLISAMAMAAPIPVSYLVEALRRTPEKPETPAWAPQLKYEYVEIEGNKIRYVKTGSGPAIVLLHTLRTQLDMWHKVIPHLSKSFTVYAMDHPGHGFSDIPESEYTAELFREIVKGFLEKLDLENATIVGESIGGTLGLMLAAEQNSRVTKVIAVNPYDYDQGKGIYRSSPIARLLFSISNLPILGATFWRLRSFPIFLNIMRGGVFNSDNLPPELMKELNQVGNRHGHYRAFMSLIKHFPEWEAVRKDYGNIKIPVLLIYGDHDWSKMKEREEEQSLIPNSELKTIANAGHFISLDASDNLTNSITQFMGK